MLLKGAGAFVVSLILLDAYRRAPKAGLVAGCLAVGLYTTILYWNLAAFFMATL